MKIAVIGAGKWGLALYNAIKINHKDIVISSRTKRDIDGFVTQKEALSAEYIIVAIAAQAIGQWVSQNNFRKDQKVLIASKGIDVKSTKFLNDILEEKIDSKNLAYLSGPSFATEVLKKLPCAVVISSKNKTTADDFALLFPLFMKAYVSDDVIGAEVCGAYKNIIAIASGICDGLALGNNARASLIARGLVEICRFGKFFGAKDETFIGLSGAGDLFLTASSNLSRNYRVGYALAKGKKLNEILDELGEVAEGVWTTKAVVKISKKYEIYTPIATEIDAILEGKEIKSSLESLLKRR